MDELVEKVREALAAEYPGAPNGRVRDVPDRRAIRWYTTIGLVDRPLGMRGRSALYGPRHLEQLVAIKRRQAEGRSIAQIQVDLVTLSPQELSEVARVPDHLLDSPSPRFWTAPPADWVHPPPAVHGVALGDGVLLVLPHPTTDRDRADIAEAAAPLLDLLQTRGLTDGRTS